MDSDIQAKIDERIKEGLYTNSPEPIPANFFRMGATFGYNLSKEEIERLKGLLEDAFKLSFPWPKQREEMWDLYKKENGI